LHELLEEFHSIRHQSKLTIPATFAKRLLVQSLPLRGDGPTVAAALRGYLSRRLSEDQRNLADILAGRKFPQDMVGADPQEAVHGDYETLLANVADGIGDAIFARLLVEGVGLGLPIYE